jgi:3-deoxy-7-phosphoheptulonate synthase
VILRGGTRTGPNYGPERVRDICARLAAKGLCDRVMIDCSHGNSLKDHTRQAIVAASICDQVTSGSPHVFGAMLESHLVGGRQDYTPGRPAVYGQSITDACISLAETEPLLEQMAKAQQARGMSAAAT